MRIGLWVLMMLWVGHATGFTIQAGDWRYLPDESYDIESIMSDAHRWQPSQWPVPNLGFTGKPYWFHLALPAGSLAEGRWTLLIRNAILTDVAVHVIEDGRVLPSPPPLDMRYPAYVMDVKPYHRYDLYLKVQSNTALQLPAELLSERSLITVQEQDGIVFGLFFGILLAMMLYNMVLFITVRDQMFLLYVGHAFALLFFVSSWQGIGATYVWPGWHTLQNMSVALSTFSVIGFSMWFCGAFLGLEQRTFPAARWFWMIRNLGFVGVLFTLFVPYQWAIFSSSFLSFFAVLMVVKAMVSRATLTYRPVRLFVMGWTMYVLGAFIMGLSKFGLIEVTVTTENLLLWGAVFDMVLLCIALGDKFHEERNIKIRAQELSIKALRREKQAKTRAIEKQMQAQHALDETAQAQAEYANTLERRVQERTQELKRAKNALEHISEQDALTQLKNRRYFVDRLTDEIEYSRHAHSEFALLMVDIDHFKMINDTHGHLAGDECIRMVGKLLQEKLQREGDVVCRYGGEEFVLILRGASESEAMLHAEAIREHVAKCPILCDEQRIMVTISVGVMMVPLGLPDVEPDHLISGADEALYRAKAQGRNCVCLAG